jgi:hypothetical protein
MVGIFYLTPIYFHATISELINNFSLNIIRACALSK